MSVFVCTFRCLQCLRTWPQSPSVKRLAHRKARPAPCLSMLFSVPAYGRITRWASPLQDLPDVASREHPTPGRTRVNWRSSHQADTQHRMGLQRHMGLLGVRRSHCTKADLSGSDASRPLKISIRVAQAGERGDILGYAMSTRPPQSHQQCDHRHHETHKRNITV